MKGPLQDWSSATTKFKEHQEKPEIHKTAMKTMQYFHKVKSNAAKPINEMYDEKISSTIKLNRLKLRSITQTVLLCGRENIPLHGHRDDAKHYDSADCGNFQALLNFRVESGDSILLRPLQNSRQKCNTLRKDNSEQSHFCCLEEINKQILDEIRNCGPISILADEVTYCSNHQLMPLVIRYVDQTCEIQERCLKYISCDTGTKGEAMKDKILTCLTSYLNLDINNCRGQCYNGAGNMAGKYSGVATSILQINELALYTHCSLYRLNLAVAAACK